jgi:hypothetical protein
MSLKKNILKIYKNLIFNLKPKLNLDKQELNINSFDELFNYFGTDKGTNVINPYTDNPLDLIGHGYGKFYKEHLDIFKDKKIDFLEIGTWKGGSTASFYHYFKKARIFTLDINYKLKFKSKRINFFNCNTGSITEIKKLEKFLKLKKTENFDIIIDDGSHIYSEILTNFEIFFKKIKPGGFYIIEDFNSYKCFEYLNDANKNSLDIENILENLKIKKLFESPFISKNFQKNCFDEISDIHIHKGVNFEKNTNISTIAFIKKNNEFK